MRVGGWGRAGHRGGASQITLCVVLKNDVDKNEGGKEAENDI